MDRLRGEAEELAQLRRRVARVKERRDVLIAKARHAGFSLREIERVAGISNVQVGQLGIPRRPPTQKDGSAT